jgi:hypothetical protein
MGAVRAVLWDATWGNNMAALEWGCATGSVLWIWRDHIGRRAARWWARHYAPHAARQHCPDCQCST